MRWSRRTGSSCCAAHRSAGRCPDQQWTAALAWFCAECGTTLWSDYGARKVMLFVRVAALDEPAALPPDVHIFTRSRLPWVELSGGAPGFEVYYDMAALWPAESLRRREALLGEGR